MWRFDRRKKSRKKWDAFTQRDGARGDSSEKDWFRKGPGTPSVGLAIGANPALACFLRRDIPEVQFESDERTFFFYQTLSTCSIYGFDHCMFELLLLRAGLNSIDINCLNGYVLGLGLTCNSSTKCGHSVCLRWRCIYLYIRLRACFSRIDPYVHTYYAKLYPVNAIHKLFPLTGFPPPLLSCYWIVKVCYQYIGRVGKQKSHVL